MRKIFLFCCVVSFFGCRPRQSFQVQWGIADVVITNEQLDSTVMILKRRLDLLKDEKAAIRVDRTNRQITIETFSIKNESEARYFASAGQVKFSECYTVGEIYPMLEKAAASFEIGLTENKPDKGIDDLLAGIAAPENVLELLLANRPGSPYPENSAELGFVRQVNKGKLVKLLTKASSFFPGNTEFLFGKPSLPDNSGKDSILIVYAAKSNMENQVDNSCIETVQASTNDMAQAVIGVKFNRTGTYRWRLMTKMNVNRPIVISVDGQVYCAPIVISEIHGGNALITGGYSIQEANLLANAISFRQLPLHLKFNSISKL
jgi:hypothetical protein